MPVRRKGVKKLFLLVSGVAVLSSLLVAASASLAPVPANLAGPMRFTSLASSPETPLPWQDITVNARLEGPVFPPTVNLQYAAYFGTVEAGTLQMQALG